MKNELIELDNKYYELSKDMINRGYSYIFKKASDNNILSIAIHNIDKPVPVKGRIIGKIVAVVNK